MLGRVDIHVERVRNRRGEVAQQAPLYHDLLDCDPTTETNSLRYILSDNPCLFVAQIASNPPCPPGLDLSDDSV